MYIEAESLDEAVGNFVLAFPDHSAPSTQKILNIFEYLWADALKAASTEKKRRWTGYTTFSVEREIKVINICSFVEIGQPCTSRTISDTVDVSELCGIFYKNMGTGNRFQNFSCRWSRWVQYLWGNE